MTTRNIGGADTAIRTVLGSLFMVWAAVVADLRPFLALGVALVAVVILATAMPGSARSTRRSASTRRHAHGR